MKIDYWNGENISLSYANTTFFPLNHKNRLKGNAEKNSQNNELKDI